MRGPNPTQKKTFLPEVNKLLTYQINVVYLLKQKNGDFQMNSLYMNICYFHQKYET